MAYQRAALPGEGVLTRKSEAGRYGDGAWAVKLLVKKLWHGQSHPTLRGCERRAAGRKISSVSRIKRLELQLCSQ